MEFEDIIEDIKKVRDKEVSKLKTRVLVASVTALKSEYTDRLFERGLDSTDSKIGSYSTKPYYASKEDFVRKGSFRGVGKTGEKKFKSGPNKGKPHNSMYLQHGYKEFRDIQGRPTGAVNADLSGSLKNNVQVVEVSETEAALALTSQKEILKKQGLEKRFGKKIFSASPGDLKFLTTAITAEIEAVKGQ